MSIERLFSALGPWLVQTSEARANAPGGPLRAGRSLAGIRHRRRIVTPDARASQSRRRRLMTKHRRRSYGCSASLSAVEDRRTCVEGRGCLCVMIPFSHAYPGMQVSLERRSGISDEWREQGASISGARESSSWETDDRRSDAAACWVYIIALRRGLESEPTGVWTCHAQSIYISYILSTFSPHAKHVQRPAL